METEYKDIKILIVEDEVIVALEIKNVLQKHGFTVTNTVTNYYDAIDSVKEDIPDIIFMDINLENSKDGIETAIKIKSMMEIPIVYLTAFSDEKTMLRAVATEPSHYIIKPFKRDELRSTVLITMYKMENKNKDIVQVNYCDIGYGYYFDLEKKNLFYKKKYIKLSPNESSFLKLLVKAKGNQVSFSQFEDYIWNGKEVSPSTLRTVVYRLGAKLEFKLIKTIPSYGYQLST